MTAYRASTPIPDPIATAWRRGVTVAVAFLALLAIAASAHAQAKNADPGGRADALIQRGYYADAEDWARRAVDLAESQSGPNSLATANALMRLGVVLDLESRETEALAIDQRVLALDEAHYGAQSVDIAPALSNLANALESLGRIDDAIPLRRRTLRLAQLAGSDQPFTAFAMTSLASDIDRQGRHAEAAALLYRALDILAKSYGPNDPRVETTIGNLGTVLAEAGHDQEAEPLLSRAAAIVQRNEGPDHPLFAWAVDHLAALYRDENRLSDAEPLQRRAVAIATARAAQPQNGAVGNSTETQSMRDIFLDQVALSAAFAASGDSGPDAARRREEGFAALQWTKASGTAAAVAHMAARFSSGTDALAALARAQQDAAARVEAIDQALLAALARPAAERDADTETKLRDALAALSQQLAARNAELAARFPAYAELANPKPAALALVQASIRPDEALLAFGIGREASYVAVVRHDSYSLTKLPFAEKKLAAEVKTLRLSIEPGDSATLPAFAAGTAYRLYRDLIAPVETSLTGVTRIYAVTDGALDSLPLGVLLTAEPASDTMTDPAQLRDAPWLMRRFTIALLPSISSLTLRKSAGLSKASLPFLGIGDPQLHKPPPGDAKPAGLGLSIPIEAVFRGDRVDEEALRSLPSLPDTSAELQAEATLFAAGPDSLQTQEHATVSAIKKADLADRRVIVFATHGLVAGEVGAAEPGLVLTPPAIPTPADDGLLRASDIARLHLDADLVVLSACNTAAPDGTPGAEGFSGLAKAFIYAGARALLVSHWSVDSAATRTLMTQLVTHLRNDRMGRAEALRAAMLDVAADKQQPFFSHPFFWAPFVIVGDGG